MKLTFLSAGVPLTKTITLKDGVIHKDSYPLLNRFTSHEINVENVLQLYHAIKEASRSAQKPCLLKGTLSRPLINESRKNGTKTNTATQLAVFDLDRARFNTPGEFMRAIGLEDVSYVVQYSASYKLDKKDKTLSCHIFCLLDRPRPAPELKAWLMHLNLTVEVLKKSLTLSNSQFALRWTLDITCCQNDKLIYIAEPTFVGMKSPVPPEQRVQLVKGSLDAIPVEQIAIRPMDVLKGEARQILNGLQSAAGLTLTKRKTKMIGEYEVQSGVSEITRYEVFDDGEYNRLNLNGGDSRAYYHLKTDPSLLHNFKGEPFAYIKELLPQYYADLMRDIEHDQMTPDAMSGQFVLAYRDKVTADYFKGTWDPAEKKLELYRVKSRDQLEDFLLSHRRTPGLFIPEWETIFDPTNPVVVDDERHILNTFVPGHYMQKENQKRGQFPMIQRVLDSAVGTGEIQDHFLNWLAYIFQFRKKPLTAWVLHGTYGTGKGMLISRIISPVFGRRYVREAVATILDQEYNDYLANKLIVFIDEIDAGMFENSRKVESRLFHWITDPTIDIRRMRTDFMCVDNFVSFIFSSNKPEPVRIPYKDRRFNVGTFQRQRFEPTDEEVASIESELPYFAHFLQHYKIRAKDANKILETEERAKIQALSRTSIDQVADALTDGNLGSLIEAMPDVALMNSMGVLNPTASAYTALIKRFCTEALGAEPSKVTRDELAVIFGHCVGKIPEGAHKFTAFLRHRGIQTKVLRMGDETPRGIEVAWKLTQEDIEYIKSTFKPEQPAKLKVMKGR